MALKEDLAGVLDAVNAKAGTLLSAEELLDWIAGYLEAHDQDTNEFPSERGKPHWDLIFLEGRDPSRATFLLAFFRAGGVKLMIGVDRPSKLQNFGENDFPDDATLVPDEVRRLFQVETELEVGEGSLRALLKGGSEGGAR
jgi:hypothetical protein